MKHIILLGLLVVLNIFCLSAKEANSPLKLEMFSMMNDTVDTNTIIIPNVFSPNGDGINDLFKASGVFTKLDVNIYNRYGELIFNSIQLNEGWNGRTTSGTQCPEGTYFYIINTDSETFTGSLTLFR